MSLIMLLFYFLYHLQNYELLFHLLNLKATFLQLYSNMYLLYHQGCFLLSQNHQMQMVQHLDIIFQILLSNILAFFYLILLYLLYQYEFFFSLIRQTHLLNYSLPEHNQPDNNDHTYFYLNRPNCPKHNILK